MKVTSENFNECLTLLKKMMHDVEASFTFIKKDGSERTARGTLNIGIMGEENAPKGIGDNYATDTVTRYFDLNSHGWRSFRNVDLVEIIEQ